MKLFITILSNEDNGSGSGRMYRVRNETCIYGHVLLLHGSELFMPVQAAVGKCGT